MTIRVVAFILVSILSTTAHSATITVGTGQTYTTIASGIAAMAGGDTLLVKDGTYSDSISSIPSGTSGAYTVIKAENDGAAVISGGLSLIHSNQYIQVEGFKFTGIGQKLIAGNHNKFLRCAFQGAPSTDNVSTISLGASDYNDTAYILLEDCWSYGTGGRYNISIFNSDHVILRRFVARHDGGWSDTKGDPEAAVAVYNSSHVELQNVIAIDSNLSTYHTWDRAFYTIWNSGSPGASGIVHLTNNVNWTGAISLNNLDAEDDSSWCFESDATPGSEVISSYTDVVCWSPGGGGFAGGSGSGNIIPTINRATFGASAKTGSWQGGFAKWNTGTMTITNAIASGFGSTDFGSLTAASYSDRYDNGASGTCTNCQTYNPATNGLIYLPRIEDSGALKTAGSSGGQVGATILKKVGVSGTLWGDEGYDTVTSDNLWPWPNENRIKSDMESVDARGFATGTSMDGSSQTLTKYVWEYLGNQIPGDIYGQAAGKRYRYLSISNNQ